MGHGIVDFSGSCFIKKPMEHLLPVIVFVVILAFLFWIFIWPSSRSASRRHGGSIIDPEDSYQIALLVGMAGGTFADAVVVRYALQRFKEIHGRPATDLDAATLIGIMRGYRGD
ncbi:MAG: hypothetical protein V4584_09215 [Verrucomicrobiota bacterium]